MLLSTTKDENRKNQLIAERDAILCDIEDYRDAVAGEALVKILRLKCAWLCYCGHGADRRRQYHGR